MKLSCSFLAILLTLAGCLFTSAPCLAYPALTEQINYSISGGSTVNYSIYDPSRNMLVGESRTVNTPTGLYAKDGVVNWISKDTLGRDLLWLAVYDPGLGRWQTQSIGFLSVASTPLLSDGVVACVVQGYGIEVPIITSVFFAIYDPALQSWRTGVQEVPEVVFGHLANSQGIVVLGYSDAQYGRVFYFIYDPIRTDWIKGNYFQAGTQVFSVSVANYQAQAMVGGDSWSWGYDPGPGTWTKGALTKPLAVFVAQPASGSRPLLVWFTDMSIGANAWSYHYLDVNAYVIARSSFRKYTQAGSFGVGYGVSGPGGSSNAPEKTIRVCTPLSALPLLLLD